MMLEILLLHIPDAADISDIFNPLRLIRSRKTSFILSGGIFVNSVPIGATEICKYVITLTKSLNEIVLFPRIYALKFET